MWLLGLNRYLQIDHLFDTQLDTATSHEHSLRESILLLGVQEEVV